MKQHALPILFASVLTATAVFAGGGMSLDGSEWGLGADDSDGVMVKFEPGNKVWGRLGCNRFTGTYERKGTALTFGTLATTKMACDDAKMKTEQQMSAALKATRKIDVSHVRLVLQDGKGGALVTLRRRDFD